MTCPWCVTGKCCNALLIRWPLFFVWPVPKKCLIFGPILYAFCFFCGVMGSTGVQSYNSSMDWCSSSCLPNRKFGLQTKLITWMLRWYEKICNLMPVFVDCMSLCLDHLFYVIFDCVIIHVFMKIFHFSPFSVYSSVHGW